MTMAACKEDISRWFDSGIRQNATHMIVATDTFDWEDFPIYVKPGQDVNAIVKEYQDKPMSKVMEVYNFGKDKQSQMDERICWNLK